MKSIYGCKRIMVSYNAIQPFTQKQVPFPSDLDLENMLGAPLSITRVLVDFLLGMLMLVLGAWLCTRKATVLKWLGAAMTFVATLSYLGVAYRMLWHGVVMHFELRTSGPAFNRTTTALIILAWVVLSSVFVVIIRRRAKQKL